MDYSETPEEELFDKNKNKLDGTHKRVIADGPKEDEYDRFGNKINGTFRKKGNKLKVLWIKSNPVQDKLSGNRFGRWR